MFCQCLYEGDCLKLVGLFLTGFCLIFEAILKLEWVVW